MITFVLCYKFWRIKYDPFFFLEWLTHDRFRFQHHRKVVWNTMHIDRKNFQAKGENPNKICHDIYVYRIQNDRTDHTMSTKKQLFKKL